jgi:hypothetical protein
MHLDCVPTSPGERGWQGGGACNCAPGHIVVYADGRRQWRWEAPQARKRRHRWQHVATHEGIRCVWQLPPHLQSKPLQRHLSRWSLGHLRLSVVGCASGPWSAVLALQLRQAEVATKTHPLGELAPCDDTGTVHVRLAGGKHIHQRAGACEGEGANILPRAAAARQH